MKKSPGVKDIKKEGDDIKDELHLTVLLSSNPGYG